MRIVYIVYDCITNVLLKNAFVLYAFIIMYNFYIVNIICKFFVFFLNSIIFMCAFIINNANVLLKCSLFLFIIYFVIQNIIIMEWKYEFSKKLRFFNGETQNK